MSPATRVEDHPEAHSLWLCGRLVNAEAMHRRWLQDNWSMLTAQALRAAHTYEAGEKPEGVYSAHARFLKLPYEQRFDLRLVVGTSCSKRGLRVCRKLFRTA